MNGLPGADDAVYLTFDDGPDPAWTPHLLDMLAAFDARATFFMIGQQVRAHPLLAQRVAAAGHTIGNHTWSHRHPWTLGPRQARQEVRDGTAAIADVTGEAPAFYRPPHGRWHPTMVRMAEKQQQTLMLWHRTALDWGPLGTANAISRRLARTQPGEIVLLHDGARQVNRPDQLLQVLPGCLAEFKRRQWVLAALADGC